jgi:hypothetical protein
MRKSDMRRIVKEDNARRAVRQAMEDAILGLGLVPDPLSDRAKIAQNMKPGTKVNACLVRGIGTVNPPLPTSASRNSWDRGMTGRVVGIAPGTEETAKESTVRVIHADGTDEIRTVSSFRKSERNRTTRRTTQTTKPETSRIELKGMDWSQ